MVEIKNEYQGGFYALIEFIGLYVRYFFLLIFGKGKELQYLSGEVDFFKN
jgi:hypothetical protein